MSKGIFVTMFVTSSQLMRDALPNNPAKSSFIQNLSPCANCEALLVRILGRQLPSLPSIPPPILCHKQGRSQGMQRVPMHPRGSVPPPPPPSISYTPMWSHQSEFSWDTYEASCSQMRSFEVLGAPNRNNHPSWGPLEQAGAPEQQQKGPFGDYGAPVRRGPLGQMHPSRNILATSMVTNACSSEEMAKTVKYPRTFSLCSTMLSPFCHLILIADV